MGTVTWEEFAPFCSRLLFGTLLVRKEETKLMSRINNYLFRLRRIRGYSQKTLSRLLLGECSVKALSDFERGLRLPPLRVAMLLEIILGTKVSEIYVDMHRELGLAAVDREAKLPPRFKRHIRGRVLGKD